MTTHTAGTPGIDAPRSIAPPPPLPRLSRLIVSRAALRGRISWYTALPMLAAINGGRG